MTHLRGLFGLSKLKNDSGLRKLLDDTEKLLGGLKVLGEPMENLSTIILYWLALRLDLKTEKGREKI